MHSMTYGTKLERSRILGNVPLTSVPSAFRPFTSREVGVGQRTFLFFIRTSFGQSQDFRFDVGSTIEGPILELVEVILPILADESAR